ncbi:MAG: two-component sensor histidine kinase, partial [Acetobacteraceae bacterium]
MLVGPDIRRVAGNLNAWPPTVTRTDGWYELQVQRAGVRSLAYVHRYDLSDHYVLLVGRDI